LPVPTALRGGQISGIKIIEVAVSVWEEWQIQFEEVYDGAYRYVDRCGEFMSAAREKFGFMPNAINPSGCDMEAPDYGLHLRASSENLIILCSNPAHRAEFIEASVYCSKKANELFEPFSVHHDRFISRQCKFPKTSEESFKMSLECISHDINAFAKVLSMTPFVQDRAFTFQSGSQQIYVKLNPIALGTPLGERKLPIQGMPREYSKFLLYRGDEIRALDIGAIRPLQPDLAILERPFVGR
jgi:hypothetical protein